MGGCFLRVPLPRWLKGKLKGDPPFCGVTHVPLTAGWRLYAMSCHVCEITQFQVAFRFAVDLQL